jgi:hypothetical protein
VQPTVGRDFTRACDYPGGQASETNSRPIGALSVGWGSRIPQHRRERATCVPTGVGFVFFHATCLASKDAV